MKEPVIVSGARTPIGRFGGGLRDVSAADFGAAAIRAALARGRVALPTGNVYFKRMLC